MFKKRQKKQLMTFDDYWKALKKAGWGIYASSFFTEVTVWAEKESGHNIEVKKTSTTPLGAIKKVYVYIKENMGDLE